MKVTGKVREAYLPIAERIHKATLTYAAAPQFKLCNQIKLPLFEFYTFTF